MIDLSNYNLTIGKEIAEIDDWFKPVFDRGRGASFIDTGFLRALLYEKDQYSAIAKNHFKGAVANFYTTNLVLAEIVRQIAKSNDSFIVKKNTFDNCHSLLIESNAIYVCAPPREIILKAVRELKQSQEIDSKLDLCDILSITVLDYANHKRVFGFDSHFSVFGAQLEP
jgi:predicted nucleic acid-binding protein